MKILAIIQARLGSSRLPRKVFLDLEGRSVLERVLDRVRASKNIDTVIVATTDLEEDLEIAQLCGKARVAVYRGSCEDVLDRYYKAALLYKPDHIVRVTADCPILDPKVIDSVVERHLRGGADYTSNICPPTYPDGEDVEAFTFGALEREWSQAKLKSDREHVTTYIRNNSGLFRIANVKYGRDLSAKRWTLDNAEDYEFLRLIYRNLVSRNPLFSMEDVLTFLAENPETEAINSRIKRNEGYQKSLKQDGKLLPS